VRYRGHSLLFWVGVVIGVLLRGVGMFGFVAAMVVYS